MTPSNKIFLKALLEIEFEMGRSQKIFERENLFFSTQLSSFHSFDLLEIILSALPIPSKDYEFLYDLLDHLSENQISVEECLEQIEKLILENNT